MLIRTGSLTHEPRYDLAAGLGDYDYGAVMARFQTRILLPFRKVSSLQGRYPVWNRLKAGRIIDTSSAAFTGFNRGNHQFSMDSFALGRFAAEYISDPTQSADFNSIVNVDQRNAQAAYFQVASDLERKSLALLSSAAASGITETNYSATPYTSPSHDLIGAVDVEIEAIQQAIGERPNVLVMNDVQFRTLRIKNTGILNSIMSSGAGQSVLPSAITKTLIAQALGVDQVVVIDQRHVPAPDVQAGTTDTGTFSPMWPSTRMLLARVQEDAQDPYSIGLGCTFVLNQGDNEYGCIVEQYADNPIRGTVTRALNHTVQKLTFSKAGRLLQVA